MQPGTASRTAKLIAMYRALHLALTDDPILVDPWAAKMIPAHWRFMVQSRVPRSFYLRFVNDIRPFMVSFMVRSRIAEDLLEAKCKRGPMQWVLLGAGLDTYAWRHPEHSDLAQFEVDHPETQAHKRAMLAKLGLTPPTNHRFVSVDFERMRIADALRTAGFDPSVPAVFAWLGVTYYLTREAIVSTLSDVASIAAPGSAIVCDYRVPDQLIARPDVATIRKGDRILDKWGEPHLTKLEPEEWPALVSPPGWNVDSDYDPEAIGARFNRDRQDNQRAVSYFRLLVLERAGR